MILGNISYIDCLIFILFLIPQLLWRVPLPELLKCGAGVLPFLVLRMPYELVRERYFTPRAKRSPFCQRATVFQDLVIRCVRFAFANFPSRIGRVFFSKPVALPFTRFRMLRHGYLSSPLPWREIRGANNSFQGLYITSPTPTPSPSPHRTGYGQPQTTEGEQAPDIILYYLHGGGFSMGSSYFYLEFLLALCTLLHTRAGFRRPAVVALEYTLVPDATFPTQAEQTRAGFEWCVEHVLGRDAGKVVIAGDSAGATLGLGLLVSLAMEMVGESGGSGGEQRARGLMPGLATLMSPWCVLVSPTNRDTRSDYLNAETLHLYARQYAGAAEDAPAPDHAAGEGSEEGVKAVQNGNGSLRRRKGKPDDPLQGHLSSPVASPGLLTSAVTWRHATPLHGFHFVYGQEEVFGPDAREVVGRIRGAWAEEKSSVEEEDVVLVTEEEGGIHAWPVVNLFLGESGEQRMRGIEGIVDVVGKRIKGDRNRVWRP